MSQAAPGKLGDERKQAEGEYRQKALVAARPLHRPMITPALSPRSRQSSVSGFPPFQVPSDL